MTTTLPGARTVTRARPAHRPQLDGIRALAVTGVLLFHLGLDWIPGGFIGVDVFFVLSGYLISGLLISEANARGAVSLTRFYARRARRLLPAAWVVILFSVLVARVVSSPLEYENVRRHAQSAALYVANWDWVSVDRGYFATDTEPSPLIHFWTLAVEEQFYFVWPALVLVCVWLARRTRARLHVVLAVTFAGIALVSVVLAVSLTPSVAAYYGTHTRAFELAAGGLLALSLERRARRRVDEAGGARARREALAACVLAGVGLATVVVEMVTISGSENYPGWSGVAVTLSSLLLISGVDLADRTLPARLFSWAPLVWIGALSYSIYLWHWPLIAFWGDDLHPLTLVALTLAASVASYYVVEQPVRRGLVPTAAFWKVALTGFAISALLATVVVPNLLRNSPLEQQAVAARHDIAAPTEGCPYAAHTWPSPEESDVCLVRDGSGPTVLLIGDSHAQMWAPGLKEIADRADWRLLSLTRAKCTPSDFTAVREADQGEDVTVGEACTTWRHVVYPWVIERHRPDYVIVGSRSHIFDIQLPDRVVGKQDASYRALWRQAWVRTVQTFAAEGARVLVLTPVPTLPHAMMDCVARSSTSCEWDLSLDPDVARATGMLAHLVRQPRSPARLIDVQQIVCPQGVCPGRIDGSIVHQDGSHVTATFAEASAPDLAALLADAGVPVTH